MAVSLADQIAAVARELSLRKRHYPGLVARGRKTPTEAATDIAEMAAVLATLMRLQAEQTGQGTLFDQS